MSETGLQALDTAPGGATSAERPSSVPSGIRVGLDARRGIWMPYTGIGRYVGGLVSAAADTGGVELCPLVARGQPLPARGLRISPGLREKQRLVWEQLSAPLTALRRLQVLHLPWYEGSPLTPVPLVLTVQDLHSIAAEHLYPWQFHQYYNRLLRLLVRRAALVIVPSQSTADDVASRWPRSAPKIRIIPYGHAAELVGCRDASRSAGRGPTAMYCGGYEPRKRVDTMIRAFARVARVNPEVRLHLVGTPPPSAHRLAEDVGIGEKIVTLGQITDDDLRQLYATADVALYVSEYEGFGFPALDALTAGVPLVAGNATSVPEIVGDCGALVPPDDVDGVAHAVLRALRGGPEVRDEVARGGERALSFTWEKCWNRHADVYREAAS